MSAIRMISGNTITVDETAELPDMEKAATYFFNNKHGARETYTVYRGCIIVRCTPRGMERKTAVHLFGISSETNKKTFMCASSGCKVDSINEAKRLIDTVLAQGWYNYGLQPF